MNLLTAGVMKGMIGAASSMKLADVSMGVYSQAKNKGDEATMKRALGYATDSMKSAEEDSQTAQKSLEEAQIEAKEEAKIEQKDLDKKAQDASQAQKDQQQAALNQKSQEAKQIKQASEKSTYVGSDSVVISNEGRAATQENGQDEVVQSTQPQTTADIPDQSASNPIPEAKIYTSKGEVKPVNVKAKLSVSA